MNAKGAVKWGLLSAAVLSAAVGVRLGAAEDETGSALSADEARTLVDFHNDKRHEVNVPPLAWSVKLAAFAQEWADHIAETGTIEHRPREGEFKEKYGENMAWGPADFGVPDADALWYAEKKVYDGGKQKLPDDLLDIGHYTQMAWKTTTKVGAGKAVIKNGKLKGWTVIVANYDPPGNYSGQKPY